MSNVVLRSVCFVVLLLLVPFFQIYAIGGADDDDPSMYTADGRPIYAVPRIATEVHIDGVLDDEVWANALVLELNYEVLPGENVQPPVRTEVLLAYGESTLYAAFRAYDPDPSAIRARIRDHDNLGGDDWVGLVLDTFNDERRCFDFIVNPLGVQYDQIESQYGEDSGWDAIWASAGRITDWGYAVEIAIPFNQLRFQRSNGNQVWSFDAVRSYPRTVRHHIGLFPRDRSNNCYLCQAIKISGFDGATPGRNIEINPTVTAVHSAERADLPGGDFETRAREAEVGLTASWGITPNMTLNATANPDFSQVEADALQLDINEPFALFYQERRPFFTEGADFFSTRLDTVYTRTMRDPSWGFKLTGKEGSNTFGAYVVRDELTNLIFPGSQSSSATSLAMASTASVFRYKRDLGSRYTLGLLATDREGDDYFNRVLGFDGDFRFTDTDRVLVQFLGSSTRYPGAVAEEFGQPREDFGDRAIEVFYMHDARNFDYWGGYREVGVDFRADLGFMPQVGYRRYHAAMDYTWIPTEDTTWHSGVLLQGQFFYYEDQDGNLLNREAYLNFNYGFPFMQSHANVQFRRIREAYNGIEFDQNDLRLHTCGSPNGDSNVGITVYLGDRIDYANTRPGKRLRITPFLSYDIGQQLRVSIDHSFERLSVEAERLYTANISQATIIYQLSTRALFRSILQYIDYGYNAELYIDDIDPIYRRLSSQLLFSYKLNPRTVLFVGYSDNYFGSHEFGITQADRTFFVKLGYAWVL